MTFLKRLGNILIQATSVIAGFGPFVVKTTPTDKDDKALPIVIDTLSHVASLVVTAEAMGQAIQVPGPQKAKMVAPLIAQAILQSQFAYGQKIAKDKEGDFLSASERLGAALADALNCFEDSTIKTIKVN